jgi:predicted nucleotide-binding protein
MSVDPRLMRYLENRTALSKRHLQRLITDTANSRHVSRHVAALLVASELKVGYQRFASEDDLAAMRAVTSGAIGALSPVAPSQPRQVASSRPNPSRAPAIKNTRDNSLFVVHGRDGDLTASMYQFLRALGLNPIEWSEAIRAAKGANPNVGEVIDTAMKKVQGVLVMFSPDEEAKLKTKFCNEKDRKNNEHRLAGQARPNVIFEAGLALGAYPKKTILVEVGDVRKISDIAGKHMVHLNNGVPSRKELAQRLQKLGFRVNMIGKDWMDIGDFRR